MLLIRTETQFDQSARVGRGFRLPAVVRLIFLHGGLGCRIPGAGWFAAHIVLANKCFLDLVGTRGIDLLLSAFT